MSTDNPAVPTDWASPKLRALLDRAQTRHQEWRDLDLSAFNADLVTPDGAPQTLRVWVNAPSALREALDAQEYFNGDTYYNIIAAYIGQDPAWVRDLFESWEDSLRHYVRIRIGQMIVEYRDERLNLLFS